MCIINMAVDSSPAFAPFQCGTLGFAYNEPAFRHFLGIERRRADRSQRSLLLVLVKDRRVAGKRQPLGPLAAPVFDVLGASLREVDFVGWYREGTVAAAVVTLTPGAGPDVERQIRERVSARLASKVPAHAGQLRIRVVRLAGKGRH